MKATSKSIVISAITTFAIFGAFFYVSCNRDKCKTIVCANDGVCSQGACTCPSGYGGTNCETVLRQKFLGNWQVFEKGSNTNSAQYAVSITEGPKITDLLIQNFYNFFNPVTVNAYVGGVNGDSMYIPNQQLMGHVTFGVGNIYSTTTYGQFGSMNVRYEVVDTATGTPNDFGCYISDLSAPSAWNK